MAKYRIPLLLSMIVILTSVLSFAQRAARNYNPNTEITLKGTVQKVNETAGQRGFNGIHLEFKSGDNTYNVHMGPSTYIAKQGFTFAPGDEIEVTGSKVNMRGNEVIIARQIKKAGKTLVLRNVQGIPEWSGGMQRQQ